MQTFTIAPTHNSRSLRFNSGSPICTVLALQAERADVRWEYSVGRRYSRTWATISVWLAVRRLRALRAQ